jgi:hypothetical protein
MSSNKNLDVMAGSCHSNYAERVNRIAVQASLSIKVRPYSKK